MLGMGYIGLSRVATDTKPGLNTTAQNESFAIAEGVFSGIGQGAGTGIVWFGVAAIVLVALGFLVASGGSGR